MCFNGAKYFAAIGGINCGVTTLEFELNVECVLINEMFLMWSFCGEKANIGFTIITGISKSLCEM